MAGILESFFESFLPHKDDRYADERHPVMYHGRRPSAWPEGTLGNLLHRLRGRCTVVTVYNGPKSRYDGFVSSPCLERLKSDPRFGVHKPVYLFKPDEIHDSVLERRVLSYDIITDRLTDWKNLSDGSKEYFPTPESFSGRPDLYPYLKVYVEHRNETDLKGEFVYG